MPRRKTANRQKPQPRKESPATPAQAITPPVRTDVEPPEPQQPRTNREENVEVAKPRRLTTWMQTWSPIVLNVLALIVITLQAVVMERTLEDARISRELENRAWVTLKEMKMARFGVGQIHSLSYLVVNNGKNPALDVFTKIEVRESVGTPLTHTVPMKPEEVKTTTTIPYYPHPAGTIGSGQESTVPIYSSAPLDGEKYAAITSKQIFLHLLGSVEYTDIFGKRHHATFCGTFDPSTDSFGNCGGGEN